MSIDGGKVDQAGKLTDQSNYAPGEVMEGNAGANITGQYNNMEFENGKSSSASASGAGSSMGHQGMAS